MVPPTKKIRNSITLDKKLQIIHEAEKGVKPAQLCDEYQLSRTTIKTIIENREKIKRSSKQLSNLESKKYLTHVSEDPLERALVAWLYHERDVNVPLTGTLLKRQALHIHDLLNLNDPKRKVHFKASDGWLDKFKKRNGLHIKGEKLPKRETDIDNKYCLYCCKTVTNALICSICNKASFHPGCAKKRKLLRGDKVVCKPCSQSEVREHQISTEEFEESVTCGDISNEQLYKMFMELHQSVQFMSNQFNELITENEELKEALNEINSIKKENNSLKKKVRLLEERISHVELCDIDSVIEIHGSQVKENTSPATNRRKLCFRRTEDAVSVQIDNIEFETGE